MPNLKKRFLLISLVVIVLASCKPLQIDGIVDLSNKTEIVQNNYFTNPEIDYVYKAQIEVYGNPISGIFVTKKINNTTHRIVFTTEFGNKLLDFEIENNNFKVNYIVEDLDRKIIINTLKEDFKLLLQEKYKITQIFKNEKQLIYKSNIDNSLCYLYCDGATQNVLQLRKTTKYKEKVIVDFVPKNSTFAEKITITHKNIKLKIELNQIVN